MPKCLRCQVELLILLLPRRVLKRCGELYYKQQIQPVHPITILRASDALRSAVPENIGLGMHVLSYDKSTSFHVVRSNFRKSQLQFNTNATYLLVGCLGGLGSAVALWMADRGARHLAFISRTGTTNNPSATATVRDLERRGVNVLVLRANIMHREELASAIRDIGNQSPPLPPIRGVLNAAGVLHDGLFSNMTAPIWHKTTDPKVQGCLNLHHVFSPSGTETDSSLEQGNLDFFVMTSSVACALGSGGQSNYAAANACLDSLARHRRSRNLAAVSLVLPAILGIGYIASHPEIERSIQSKGMYGIREKEMLEAFELAMMPQSNEQDLVGDHLIVGIQPKRYGPAIQAAGSEVPWLDNSRFKWLQMAVDSQTGTSGQPSKNHSSSRDIISTIRQAASRDAAVTAVAEHVAERLGRLLMLDNAKMHTTQRSVASHGLDSMIGAEFRNWIFREFRVDIPFQQLLAGSLTIFELARILCDKVMTSEKQ